MRAALLNICLFIVGTTAAAEAHGRARVRYRGDYQARVAALSHHTDLT
jgi:hypothetical protein